MTGYLILRGIYRAPAFFYAIMLNAQPVCYRVPFRALRVYGTIDRVRHDCYTGFCANSRAAVEGMDAEALVELTWNKMA